MGLLAVERGRRLIDPRRNGRRRNAHSQPRPSGCCALSQPRSNGRCAHAQWEPGRRATPAAAVTKRRRRLSAQPELSAECAEWPEATTASGRRACLIAQRAAASACQRHGCPAEGLLSAQWAPGGGTSRQGGPASWWRQARCALITMITPTRGRGNSAGCALWAAFTIFDFGAQPAHSAQLL